MIYLLTFLIGFLIGRFNLPTKTKNKIHQLTCPHNKFTGKEVGFQTFYTCNNCGKVWS